MVNLYDKLREFGQVDTNVSLKTLTTFKIGGNADFLVYPNNEFSLESLLCFLKNNNIDYKIFGNGSNILASDDDYHGVIIKLTRTFAEYSFNNDELSAQAGCSIISLSYKAMEHNLSGLEFASGIPGTVGGCVYMNAGAYKSDMSKIVTEVTILNNGKIEKLSNKQCEFTYRNSIFQKNPEWIILSVKIKLTFEEKSIIKELMDQRQQRRLSSQPLEYPCAGSTFRNPENGFAWQLIDEVDLRGKRINGAMISLKHSNFIINDNHATAKDVISLANLVKDKVKNKFNIDLKMEVEKFNWKK